MPYLLLAAALMMMVTGTSAATERYQIRDTSDLVDVCDTNPAAADVETALAFCHGFLVGAVHYHFAAIPEQSRFVCAPDPTPSRSQVMSEFVEWTKGHSQHMNEPAVETLFRYLAETYPCA